MGGVYISKEELQAVQQNIAENQKKGIANNIPGWTLRDQIGAITALDWGHMRDGVIAPQEGYRSIPTYKQLGASKWQGTPEENNLMMRTILRRYGFSFIGYTNLDDKSIGNRRNLIYKNVNDFDSIDDFEVRGKVKVIPNKCNNAIVVYSTIGNAAGTKRGRATPELFVFMEEEAERITRVQQFLWGLGYQSYYFEDTMGGISRPPFGIMSGLGEYNRTHGPAATPEGFVGGACAIILTDLPLAPTKPIDFGVLKFCSTCGVCANACPSGAIPTKEEMKEPTWERSTGPWSSSNDHKGYPNESVKCATWYMANTVSGFNHRPIGACYRCAAACVFNKSNEAWIHEIVKATVSTTPLLNSFFANMATQAGYGEMPSDEERSTLWTGNMAEWGIHQYGKNEW